MKWTIAILAALAALWASLGQAEKRVALVIGNAQYRNVSPLANPVNDALLMAKVLGAAGFSVRMVLNANDKQLRKAIILFGAALQNADVGLFFYAGHGIQLQGANYLVPIDAKLERDEFLEIEAVNLNQVMRRMAAARAKLNIVVLDACRNNPFPAFNRATARGLAVTQAPTGTYIAYATRPGDSAADGKGRHSPFTAALARAIPIPGIGIEKVFKKVRADVQAGTGGRQVPWTSSSIIGEFRFHAAIKQPLPRQSEVARLKAQLDDVRRRQTEEAEKRAVVERQAAAARLVLEERREATHRRLWEAALRSGDAAAVETFLQIYPDSPFAPLGRARLTKLRQRARARKLARLQAPPSSIPKKADNRMAFDGGYGGIEYGCENGFVEWQVDVRGMKFTGRIFYRVAGADDVFAISGRIEAGAGRFKEVVMNSDRELRLGGSLGKSALGICGYVKLTAARFNPQTVKAPVTDRRQAARKLPRFQASVLTGRWSDRCHLNANIVMSFDIRGGNFVFLNGSKALDNWRMSEPVVNGQRFSLTVGVIDTFTIEFSRLGPRTLRVESHNMEPYHVGAIYHPFFDPGTRAIG